MKEKMKVSIGMLVFLLVDQLTKFWANTPIIILAEK